MASFVSRLISSYTLLVLLCLFLLYLVVGAVQNYRKLSHIDGPPLARFSRLWMFWQSINGRVSKAQYDAIASYGPTCRLGPDILITGDPELIKQMNAAGSKWRRSGWFSAMRLDPRRDNVFSTRDEKVHAELKAKEAGGYNGRDIDTLESDIDDRIAELLQLIKTEYKGKEMNIAAVTRYFTLDVLSTIAFGGRKFGFMEANADLWDYDKISSEAVRVLELSLNHPFFRWLFGTPIMQALFLPKITDQKGIGPMLRLAKDAVAERFGPDAKVKKDMLGHFVSKGMSQLQIEAESNLQILAGSDSTTTVLRLALYSIAANYPAYTKLRAEIDSAKAIQSDSSIIRYSDAQRLPLLNACIWETLRLFPPLFGLKSKICPENQTVNGILIPEGTEVAICDDAVCRRRDIWGDDADLWRPGRWIGLDDESFRTLHQTVDIVFGTGRFACLGKHIAMMELHKALFELMRQFDWVIADPVKGIATKTYGVRLQPSMPMYAYPRS